MISEGKIPLTPQAPSCALESDKFGPAFGLNLNAELSSELVLFMITNIFWERNEFQETAMCHPVGFQDPRGIN